MQKQAPSVGRILVAVGFALSCFGLLLFLWVTFGGPTPFKAQSYAFTADFPEAITLAKEADVRIGGVRRQGQGRSRCPRRATRPRPTIEIEPEFAPIPSDARAILRQKTLLGETFIELTAGSQVDPDGDSRSRTTAQAGARRRRARGDDAVEPIAEGGHLDDTQVAEQVQIDEIFNALDEETRQAFQLWMQNSGDRGRRPRPRPQRRLRQPRPVHRATPATSSRSCASQEQALHGAGPRHRHGLRGAHRARPGAGRRDRRLQPHLPRARLARRGARRDVPDLPDLQRARPG